VTASVGVLAAKRVYTLSVRYLLWWALKALQISREKESSPPMRSKQPVEEQLMREQILVPPC
jgi:hypothetical protein